MKILKQVNRTFLFVDVIKLNLIIFIFLGVQILQVKAVETNGDENTQITYSIDNTVGASGNPKQYINIDSISGVISASQSLDYETLNSLLLDVIASDGTFSDTVSLTITLNNVNDNSPILTS